MTTGATIDVWLNPLLFTEAVLPNVGNISSDTILKFMCSPGIDPEPSAVTSRYKEISQGDANLFAAPNEQRILDKLIWPLKYAKVAYMLGDYIGTIAMCGMVAEMVAVLYFDTGDSNLNGRRISELDQKNLFGNKFEKLGQDRRVKVLDGLKLISKPTKVAFDAIRGTRKRYLHLWSQDHDRLPKDAKAVYDAAVQLVVEVIGQDVKNGRIMMRPAIVEYLKQSGVYKPVEAGDD